MALPLEEYGLVGDTQTVGLVGRDGSLDWLCLPRFDDRACFAALLGTPEHGRWRLAPVEGGRAVRRRYRGYSLVLEQEFETSSGAMRLIDFMPIRRREPDVVRIVEGLRGTVRCRADLDIRFDYGSVVPWMRTHEGVIQAIGGPDALTLWSPPRWEVRDGSAWAEFDVGAGERLPFVMAWHPSYEEPSPPVDALEAVEASESWWREWAARCPYEGQWRDAVLRSLVTLKALTNAPSGGILAAATTSLPEHLSGVRNWDYRHCWLRDATFTIYALLGGGFTDEAAAWHDWLLRATAGSPTDIRIMYGCGGERRIPELELPWLPGYESSAPVRVGNAAASQFQLDVFGEVIDTFFAARSAGIDASDEVWTLELALLDHLEHVWREPDNGIWEVRSARHQFTHSKVMAWVAFDRAIRSANRWGLRGPVDRWRRCRAEIHADVCARGYHQGRGAFTQVYGSERLDASLLMLPLVGFLPHTDPRVRGTVDAIARELCSDGYIRRYDAAEMPIDGLPPGEGTFLACTCWLADNYAMQGRIDEAGETFERVLAVRNDLGLLSEQFAPDTGRLLGNFPQAFSHVGVVNTARNLDRDNGPARDRGEDHSGDSGDDA